MGGKGYNFTLPLVKRIHNFPKKTQKKFLKFFQCLCIFLREMRPMNENRASAFNSMTSCQSFSYNCGRPENLTPSEMQILKKIAKKQKNRY